MTTLKRSLLAITTTAALALGASANASLPPSSNLVNNGGFEIGDFTGWTQFGDTSYSGVGDGTGLDDEGQVQGQVHSGTYAGYFGPGYAEPHDKGGIYQSLTTIAGQAYKIDFWLANGAKPGVEPSNSFALGWDGGSTMVGFTDVGAFSYKEFSVTLVASSTTTDLRFTFFQPSNYLSLDDVSVKPVPLPAALWLFGSALTGLAGIGYKRKQPTA